MRVLTCEAGVFYDAVDMFECAMDGTPWTDRWYVGGHEDVAVGDLAYVIHGDGDGASVLARGVVVEADAADRLALLEARWLRLGPAYCRNLHGLSESADGTPPLFVRFDVESVVDMDHQLPLESVPWPSGSGPDVVRALASGATLPGPAAASLAIAWDRHVAALLDDELALRLPVGGPATSG